MKHPLTGAALVAALAIGAPALAQDTTGAMQHPQARAHHATHHKMASHPRGSQKSQGDIANQLNQQELSNIQATNPTTMNRMPAGGRATSGTHQ